jgi:hypothetical protein
MARKMTTEEIEALRATMRANMAEAAAEAATAAAAKAARLTSPDVTAEELDAERQLQERLATAKAVREGLREMNAQPRQFGHSEAVAMALTMD